MTRSICFCVKPRLPVCVPSVVDPPIGEKIRLLHLMDRLGIHTADIGLPGAGPRAVEAVTALAKEIAASGLSIEANCAARTMMTSSLTSMLGSSGIMSSDRPLVYMT